MGKITKLIVDIGTWLLGDGKTDSKNVGVCAANIELLISKPLTQFFKD